MQKRAARRGQRALAFLLCLLMVVTLLPVMGASAAGGGNAIGKDAADSSSNGIVLDKYLSEDTNGNYTLTLEAYATGQTTQVPKNVPLDIILVLDQSTSMEEEFSGSSYQYTEVYNLNKNQTYYAGSSHTEVTWCSSCKAWTNGCFSFFGHQPGISYQPKDSSTASGTQFYTRTSVQSMTRMAALQQAAKQFVGQVAEQDADHKIAIVGFEDQANYLTGSSTNAFQDAKTQQVQLNNIIDNLGNSLEPATEHGKGLAAAADIFSKNPAANRQRVVVLFTDGLPEPNNSSKWSARVVKQAIDQAYALKNTYSATVYTVSVYPDSSSTGTTNMDKYMNYISSNYPNAQYLGSYSGTDEASIIKAITPGNRVSSDKNFYLTAHDVNALNNVFRTIFEDSSSSSTSLNENAVLKDVISDKFDVTDATTATVAAYSGSTDGSSYTFSTTPTTDQYRAVIEKDTKTVTVTGFDYSTKFIAPSRNGQKLVVTVTGLIPNDGFGDSKMLSNAPGAGIYESASATTPTAEFPSPWTKVPVYTKVLDFSMAANIATHVLQTNSALTGAYGTFNVSEDAGKNLTYKLGNRVADGNLVFDGVDSVLFYGDYNDDGNDTAARWNKVNVIPANNVYFDDDLLNSSSDFTDGDYGYDVAVENAANNTADIAKGSKKVFTFTGTGIDLYCTTKSDSGSVFAQLRKVNDDNSLSVVPGVNDISMNDTYESGTLYNVPTISFRNLESGKYQVTLYTDKTVDYQLDGVRVYNPGNADVEILYNADEKNATFTKVRDLLLEANSFNDGDASVTGVVYTDQIREGSHNTTAIDTYEKVGPKNEVYLATGNAIAFKVDNYQSGMKVMVGLSAPAEGQNAGEVTMSNGSEKAPTNVNSAVDMYYNVTPNADGYVVIENTGSSLISVTNVKLSGAAAVDATALSVDDGLLTYMASFDTLEVTEPAPVEPEPTPETPANNTVSAIIHAIWAQVKDSIGRLFGRL